jgi:hypothetical protein
MLQVLRDLSLLKKKLSQRLYVPGYLTGHNHCDFPLWLYGQLHEGHVWRYGLFVCYVHCWVQCPHSHQPLARCWYDDMIGKFVSAYRDSVVLIYVFNVWRASPCVR